MDSIDLKENDNINHPSHYTSGRYEVIDIIRDVLGDGFKDFCIGNVLKYVCRHKLKGNPREDLGKAAVYLEWAIEEMKEVNEDVELD